VITAFSPHNFDLVISLGADYVFDNKSSTAIEGVQGAVGGNLNQTLWSNTRLHRCGDISQVLLQCNWGWR